MPETETKEELQWIKGLLMASMQDLLNLPALKLDTLEPADVKLVQGAMATVILAEAKPRHITCEKCGVSAVVHYPGIVLCSKCSNALGDNHASRCIA